MTQQPGSQTEPWLKEKKKTHCFIVINPAVHGAPVASVLLWPYLRFTANELLSGNAESRLKASMLSYLGKMISERTSFQLNYALP